MKHLICHTAKQPPPNTGMTMGRHGNEINPFSPGAIDYLLPKGACYYFRMSGYPLFQQFFLNGVKIITSSSSGMSNIFL
jgi:hypothetical protein